MRSWILATFVVVAALGIVVGAVPFLTKERTQIAVTPQPSPLDWLAVVPLDRGQEACMEQVAIDERSEVARIQVGTRGRAGQPLHLTITAPGYRTEASIPPGSYTDSDVLSLPIRPPREATNATVCVTNTGLRLVELFASVDRTRSRSPVRVDGAPRAEAFMLTFLEARRASLLGRFPLILSRMEVFRPGFVGSWLLWLLAGLFIVAVLVAVPWALVRADALDHSRDSH